ncbi:Uncharacterised protein [Flavonifractor plautii]|uniref:Uncharacterized protein n=1 Tax=Flavonifractor plautii TaxID=292800 RepID=A0A174V6I8_FLAPL|nr:Uncharacterised protein [Flavonifractor plautii]
MREKATAPGAKCSATQSITRLASANFPGRSRCRMITPCFNRPS